ncbi:MULTISPECIES: prepilin peptidase [Actinomyces]|uniref:Prepilin peptidase n=1 Tax=Actinomyces respiraculi TaxID=2744574 RepID=A0A7T0LJP4_9ACTO|nr:MULTISPECIES: prepilin peptidase [Actinomyces]QPL05002.1 prepilin peptidase [Actinomyces respiraculi]
MSSVFPVLVALTVLAACAAAVYGPASRFAREYLDALLVDALRGADGTAEEPALRAAPNRRALLLPHWQMALFLVVACAAGCAALGSGRWWELSLALPMMAALTVAGSTDAVCHRLPNGLLGPAALWAAACVVIEVVARLAAGGGLSQALAPVGESLAAAAGLGAVTLLLALVPSGLGMGDVKLCALTGLWLGRFGWAVPVAGVVAGLFIAGTVAIVLMVLRLARRDTMIAMGPYLIVGAVAAWALAVA